MSTISYILGIVVAVLVLVIVIELLRRRRLRERHALWWIIAGLLALVAGVFPASLNWAAGLLGIEVPINLVYFVSIAVLFFVCLQHSAELTDIEDDTRALAEQVALQDMRIRQLEDRLSSESPNQVA
ncbi:MAG: DUF2304 domain-containing protein [Salinibacterium sp.]|nr:DUF2304 domain-containing protein [Salinibacterium sp.]